MKTKLFLIGHHGCFHRVPFRITEGNFTSLKFPGLNPKLYPFPCHITVIVFLQLYCLTFFILSFEHYAHIPSSQYL